LHRQWLELTFQLSFDRICAADATLLARGEGGSAIRTFNSRAIERLFDIPTIRLTTWPTPLDSLYHPQLGRLLVKRDDLAGFGAAGRSGVKARKLEGLLAHLKERDTRIFVMPLGNITSLAFDLTRAASSLGIATKFFIADDPPLSLKQRQSIFAPIAGNVELIGTSYLGAAVRLIKTWIASLPTGARTMIALPSPSHPTAIAGVARGYIEAMRQSISENGSLPETVYIAAASGSAAAGLALGEVLMRAAGAPPVRIAAVQVVPQPLFLWLPWLVRWTAQYWNLEPLPDIKTLTVIKNSRDAQYGIFDDGHEETCRQVENEFGISIDPIYGGKSWSVMEACQRRFANVSDRPALFWHCGYTQNWQDYRTNAKFQV
jgi:1-aminocyclopropane-1-carboxylate deaminase/D-cysteine desulfhydrase-like pyridoxal-dependent ACC family enzyme